METNEAVHVDENGEHDNDVEGKYAIDRLSLERAERSSDF